MSAEREGVVSVGEEMGVEEPHLLTGRFSAHWESEETDAHLEGPQGVTVQEAIDWGRARADVVYVRLGDSDVHHSAGPSNPHGDPVWPEGREVARRRQPGMEHLDLVTPEPIPWRVQWPRPVRRRRAETDAEWVRGRLAADPDAARPSVAVERDGRRTVLLIGFDVRARSHEEALDAAFEVQSRTTDELRWPRWARSGGGRRIAIYHEDFDPYDGIRPVADEP